MNVEFIDGVLYLVNDQGINVLRQPCWPDNTPWANENQARSWATNYLAWFADETDSTPEPPTGP